MYLGRHLCAQNARGVILAMVVGAGMVSVAGVAAADRGVTRDARGDARAPWDITKIVVHNGPRRLRIRVVYRGRLRPRYTPQGLLAGIQLDTKAPTRSVYSPDFIIDMLRGSTNPQVPNRLHLLGRDRKRIPCKGLRVRTRYRRGFLAFTVPQRCFGSQAGRVRLGAHTYSPRGAPDEADYIREWGRWVRRG